MAKSVEPVDWTETDLPPDFEEKVAQRAKLSAEIKELEGEKEALDAYIKGMMEVSDCEKTRVGNFVASLVHSSRSTIVADALVDQGVDPKIIAKATKVTPVVSLTIREAKD